LGLIGAGIQASRTPGMQESEAAAQGLHGLYQLIDLERPDLYGVELEELLCAAQRMGFAGLNITHPCKQAVLPLLDEVSEDARALGAVNTVVLRRGRREGFNTDWQAFQDSMRAGLPEANLRHVVQLGAGGAGSATAYALLRLGVERLILIDTDQGRAEALAARLDDARIHVADDVRRAMDGADGLVHATPTGMDSHPGLPLEPELVQPSMWLAEIVYFPLETELLRLACERGCRTLDGSGMAIHQAAASFDLFTGRTADRARMRAHFSSMGSGRSAGSSSGFQRPG
jgi:shikimate dehydrogenase